MTKRQENETLKDYTIRLFKNKDLYNINSYDIATLIYEEFGVKKDESAYRKWWNNYNEGYTDGYEEALSESGDFDELEKIEKAKLELQKEKYKFYDQRNELNKILRQQARREELIDIIKTTIESGKLQKLEYTQPIFNIGDNDLLVSLNDLHYGANVNNYWNTYNSDVCKQYLERYLAEIVSIAKLHGSTNCIVWANGDLIAGNIHKTIAVSNKENVIQQIKGVSELIALFLAELSKKFNQVSFVSVSGNHSRLDVKDDALKDERLDSLIEWYIEARLQNFKNVVIGDCDRIDETMYTIDVRGKTFIGVHGDYDGTVSKLQALQMMIGKPIYGILTAHLHHNATDFVQGVKTIMSGSFLGMDDYCITKRIYGKPQQSVSVCTDKGVKCTYDINF
jgi:hypothetical protein